jgi:hypothetical protein
MERLLPFYASNDKVRSVVLASVMNGVVLFILTSGVCLAVRVVL